MTIYDRPFCLKEQIAFGTGIEVCYLINCIVDASEIVFIVPYLAQLLLERRILSSRGWKCLRIFIEAMTGKRLKGVLLIGFGSTVRAVCFCVSTVFGISQIICFDRDNG
jgi:hypothetical protein